MLPPRTIQDVRSAFRKHAHRGYNGGIYFCCVAAMYLCEYAAKRLLPMKRAAKKSEWQKFVARETKKGRSLQHIAQDWKRRQQRAA